MDIYNRIIMIMATTIACGYGYCLWSLALNYCLWPLVIGFFFLLLVIFGFRLRFLRFNFKCLEVGLSKVKY
jgi:hypothetical protein